MLICEGLKRIKRECKNEAKYLVIGLYARFGIALETKLCEQCLSLVKEKYPRGFPKIMEYNKLTLAWKDINTLNDPFKDINGNIVINSIFIL